MQISSTVVKAQKNKESKGVALSVAHEISIVNSFPKTYRNREDITNLPPGVLVVGSQNIMSNVSERLEVRKGYKIDGSYLMYISTTAISTNKVTVLSTLGLTTGDYVKITFASGITGLTSDTNYYIIVASATTIGFALSNANALAGTYITISGTPVGANIAVLKMGINTSISSSFDFNSKTNGEVHLRAGFLTSAANDGKLQFRWKDTSNNVFWTDISSALTTVSYNFTTFWDTTELIRECLFVNGTANVYEWNGAYDTVASTTANTIVMTNTIATTGFYSTRDKKVTVRGVEYTYTGITAKTFTGVTPDPTSGAGTVYAGDIAFQSIVTTATSTFTSGPAATFLPNLISTLNNQIYLGYTKSPAFWVSKVNDYKNYAYSAGRIPGEGMNGTLDDNIVAYIPQEDVMYISAGKSFWYNTKLTQTVTSTYNGSSAVNITLETFEVKPLKTNPRQGVQSQGLVGKMKNNVIMISNEPTFDTMGRVDMILGTPQTTNISDSIKLDFDSYDFTGGHVFYWRYYLLVSVPVEGIIRMYSLTTNSWESPLTIPVTRFYTIDGELYGHSYSTCESYQLFTGYKDRALSDGTAGSPYLVVVNFSYQNFGTRTTLKNANKFYIEGYISGNTDLSCTINYEQDGNLTQQFFSVLGDDTTIVGSGDATNSLGKYPFGQAPLGNNLATSLTGLPPKFRVIKTFPRFDFYECQFSFSILGVDQNFQLLSFGMNAIPSATTNFAIEE